MYYISISILISLILLISCNTRPAVKLPIVLAAVETEAVEAEVLDDAADDPAIWIHPTDPTKSLIIGSNKTYGIEVFDLQGNKLHTYEVGRVNNIDVRYQFPLNDSVSIDIVAGTERSRNEIVLFAINPASGELREVGASIISDSPEVYGFCLYKSPYTHTYYAFLNDKEGTIEQWELTATSADSISGNLVRKMRVASQPEGMVADDHRALLYVGEELEGIWVFPAEPNQEAEPTRIPMSGEENDRIAYDIEGLAIYRSASDSLLLASSQGNNSYAAFAMTEGYPYVGSFRIGEGEAIDGTQDTDGIEANSATFQAPFDKGIFVVQDGYNTDPTGTVLSQNFKLVPWSEVEKILAK